MIVIHIEYQVFQHVSRKEFYQDNTSILSRLSRCSQLNRIKSMDKSLVLSTLNSSVKSKMSMLSTKRSKRILSWSKRKRQLLKAISHFAPKFLLLRICNIIIAHMKITIFHFRTLVTAMRSLSIHLLLHLWGSLCWAARSKAKMLSLALKRVALTLINQ